MWRRVFVNSSAELKNGVENQLSLRGTSSYGGLASLTETVHLIDYAGFSQKHLTRSFYGACVSIPAGLDNIDVMDIESSYFAGPASRSVQVDNKLFGLLPYVAQADYVSGNPLSSWVPPGARME